MNSTTEPTTTANPHPLHVHAHRGHPGEGRDGAIPARVATIAVYGSVQDPGAASGNYVNGP